MEEQGARHRPFLDLIENTGAGMDKRQKIGGNYSGKYFCSAKGEVIKREAQRKIDDSRHYRSEASEHKTSEEEIFYMLFLHILKPILSFTAFNCLRDTWSVYPFLNLTISAPPMETLKRSIFDMLPRQD